MLTLNPFHQVRWLVDKETMEFGHHHQYPHQQQERAVQDNSNEEEYNIQPTPIDRTRMIIVDRVTADQLIVRDPFTAQSLLETMIQSRNTSAILSSQNLSFRRVIVNQRDDDRVEFPTRMRIVQPTHNNVLETHQQHSRLLSETRKRPPPPSGAAAPLPLPQQRYQHQDNQSLLQSTTYQESNLRQPSEADDGEEEEEEETSASSSISNRPQKRRRRNRALNSSQWFSKYQELVEYKEQYGHCHVPYEWPDNVTLSHWVKRQRYCRALLLLLLLFLFYFSLLVSYLLVCFHSFSCVYVVVFFFQDINTNYVKKGNVILFQKKGKSTMGFSFSNHHKTENIIEFTSFTYIYTG
jgi:hypothetical protein